MSPSSQPRQFGSLPLEVLQTILRLVPRASLAPASLVCKTWRSITLPVLYESLRLPHKADADERQSEFFRRIIDESENKDENGYTFRLSGYTKRLHVESTMDEEELEFFSSAVVELKNLEHLGWTVSCLQEVDWYATLVLLCQELPKLRSLSLTMAQNDIPLGDLDECVAFTDLRELSITFDGLTDEDPDDELPHTIVQLIRGARNIESLCLKFEEDDENGAAPWGSVDLFSELALDHFPNLRTLHICSQHLVPIDNYSGPEFRQFIQRHNQLEKIHLLTGGYDNRVKFVNPPPLVVTPADMEEMMPSIRHFAGPGLLVGAILNSKLAKQIELLEFHEPAAVELGRLSDLIPELDSSTLPQLPQLKGLVIFTSGTEGVSEWEIMLNVLSKMATRMPVLQELLLCPSEKPSPEELDQLLDILDHLPHLRRLVTHVQGYPINWFRDDGTQRFYQRAKGLCPLLDTENTGEPVLDLRL